MVNAILFSSQSVHWPTDKALYDVLNEEFAFDFDPCPLGCTDDGSAPLFTPWTGRRVYCNPPYGKGIAPFLERAPEADLAVFNLPARTDTAWFHNLVLPRASEIRFVKGRLRFGDSKGNAPFPSMLVIFRKQSKMPGISEPPPSPYLTAEEMDRMWQPTEKS